MQAAGNAARGLAEVFVPNATRKLELAALGTTEARGQFAAEFAPRHPSGWFDEVVNGLNRLPRPALALGTLALFVYAMVDPQQFALRMVGLNAVPEPLWWLLGAIVSFYFGARHQAKGQEFQRALVQHMAQPGPDQRSQTDMVLPTQEPQPDGNAALEEWVQQRR